MQKWAKFGLAPFHLNFNVLSSILTDINPYFIFFLVRLGFCPDRDNPDPRLMWPCYQLVPFQGKYPYYCLWPGFFELSSLPAHFIVIGDFPHSHCWSHCFPQSWRSAVGEFLVSTHPRHHLPRLHTHQGAWSGSPPSSHNQCFICCLISTDAVDLIVFTGV